jgi:hypothetical protein
MSKLCKDSTINNNLVMELCVGLASELIDPIHDAEF